MAHSFSAENSFHYASPAGIIFMAATENGICNLNFVDDGSVPISDKSIATQHPLLLKLIIELDNYFAGKLKSFTVPVDPQGTEFQQKVWRSVAAIPYGEVVSYLKLSESLQQPGAIRAVANANARNPLLILIPCHRVIGADGNLTGYAGGLSRKKFLLELEGVLQPSQQLDLDFS